MRSTIRLLRISSLVWLAFAGAEIIFGWGDVFFAIGMINSTVHWVGAIILGALDESNNSNEVV